MNHMVHNELQRKRENTLTVSDYCMQKTAKEIIATLMTTAFTTNIRNHHKEKEFALKKTIVFAVIRICSR